MKRKNVISRVTPASASHEALRAMADHKAKGFRITNMKEILCHNATAFIALEEGTYAVKTELISKIGDRAVQIFGYAASNANECLICGNYFKKAVVDMGIDWDTFSFTEEEQDLISYAEALHEDPNHVPDDIYEALQSRYDEETMVVLVTYSCMLLANNYFNNIVGTEIDDYLKAYLDN